MFCLGPWLDGLFEMDTLLGAQFFELMCLVLLERSVLTERCFDGVTVQDGDANEPQQQDNLDFEESDGL